MALTITGVRSGIMGDLRYRVVDVAFDTTYASGGEPLTPATLSFDQIYFLRAHAPAGYKVSYDYTNATLRAYRIGVETTAAGATANNSLIKSGTSTLEVAGTGTAFQVALSEVTTGTDVSTPLARVSLFIIGI